MKLLKPLPVLGYIYFLNYSGAVERESLFFASTRVTEKKQLGYTYSSNSTVRVHTIQ